MPIKRTLTFTRPDLDTPFWVHSSPIREHIHSAYIETAKVLDVKRVEDATGLLEIKLVMIFRDNDTMTEFLDDPWLVGTHKDREDYHDIVGITKTTEVEEISKWPE
jgi:hypothetical protein